ncbi:methyltransferase family protein [Rhodohalobacter sulfatireducens]|uniref:Isoprenylcysteine carboxylmethyltransferase family protein n=1 Tax=Rhodohalobacter sulfatireducens TaxID=2911366 RepID=A0ABS9KGA7_9BACT|nr:isoprenylcysteine carboxylmethyltransferase family protein [Rhodohalobacter sulfatireducens]MCG2589873.1 isoprenylcysteine carboxylmethyltransferase family protein [Rhodohalobacter sulfatireducens]
MKFLECKIPPALQFIIIAALMWWISDSIPDLNYSSSQLKWLGISLFSVGVFIGLLGVYEFWKQRTTVDPHKPEKASSFVDTGIYRFSRNPMYLGLLVVLIGILFYFANPVNILPVIGFVLYMNRFQIIPEERVMANKFGEDFFEYKQSVRRWL